MKIIVTGCKGQLGTEIIKQLREGRSEIGPIPEKLMNATVIPVDLPELDISNYKMVDDFIRRQRPDVIINCAAHTNVDKCEEQWDLAYKINAIGPRNLSIAATEADAKMIHVSTDYVFEGNGTRPYTEFDAPNPVSAYGKTKLEGENFVKEFAKKHFILRTAWLYGDGKNFVKTMLALAENHDELNVVCDQVGTPTSAVELAKMIHYLEGTENYGTFHATCEGDTNWADFAEAIFKRAGKNVKVNHVTSKQYKEMNPASANRPAYSILEDYMIKLTSDFVMADWQDALDVYMKELLG